MYIGDVFVAAGQSNMELNYSQYYEGSGNSYNFGGGLITTDDLPKQLSDNNVHFVASANSSKGTDFPLRDVNGQAGTWLEATADNSQHFSYLAQQFAMQLRAAHPNVPIGIIQTAWGGTPIRRHVQGRAVIFMRTILRLWKGSMWRACCGIRDAMIPRTRRPRWRTSHR